MNHFLAVVLHADAKWRRTRKENVAPVCAMCGHDKEREVHHIVPWHVSPELRYDPDNLVTLCRPCHFRFGHHLDWKDWNPRVLELCGHATEIRLASARHGSIMGEP